MNTIDIRLKEADLQILRSVIGESLENIEHDEFIFTNTSSQVVRFNISGKQIYLYSFTEPLDYYGSTEDVAVWSVEKNVYPLVTEKDFIKIPIHQNITGITLVQENQQMYDHGEQTYDVWVTRGIIIDFADHQLSFEKPVWFSEDIIIRRGYNLLNAFKPVEDITNAENWNEGIELKCNRIIEIL